MVDPIELIQQVVEEKIKFYHDNDEKNTAYALYNAWEELATRLQREEVLSDALEAFKEALNRV